MKEYQICDGYSVTLEEGKLWHMPDIDPSPFISCMSVKCNGHELCLVCDMWEIGHFVFQGYCHSGGKRVHVAAGFLMIDGKMELATFDNGSESITDRGMQDVYRQRRAVTLG